MVKEKTGRLKAHKWLVFGQWSCGEIAVGEPTCSSNGVTDVWGIPAPDCLHLPQLWGEPGTYFLPGEWREPGTHSLLGEWSEPGTYFLLGEWREGESNWRISCLDCVLSPGPSAPVETAPITRPQCLSLYIGQETDRIIPTWING